MFEAWPIDNQRMGDHNVIQWIQFLQFAWNRFMIIFRVKILVFWSPPWNKAMYFLLMSPSQVVACDCTAMSGPTVATVGQLRGDVESKSSMKSRKMLVLLYPKVSIPETMPKKIGECPFSHHLQMKMRIFQAFQLQHWSHSCFRFLRDRWNAVMWTSSWQEALGRHSEVGGADGPYPAVSWIGCACQLSSDITEYDHYGYGMYGSIAV